MRSRRLAQVAMAGLMSVVVLAGCGGEKPIRTPMEFGELPLAVRRGVETAYPDATVQRIVREENEKTRVVRYRVKLVTKTGKPREDAFAPDGERIVKQ